MLTGGCLCGQVRYEAEAQPFHETICHCADCRRAAGAPVVAWFSVPRASFRVVAGEPGLYASSAGVTRGFCCGCGTSLTYANDAFPDEIDVAVCSLDDPEAVRPKDHTRTAGKLSWVELGDGLPAFPRTRPGR